MNFVHSSLTVGAWRASALSPPGSPPRRTSASQFWASERACSTVSSPYKPKAGLRRSPAFVRYWSMNTLRPVGVILHRKPGTSVSRSSTGCAWGCAASTADLVILILAMTTPRETPISRCRLGATVAAPNSDGLGGPVGHQGCAQQLLNLGLELARLFVLGKLDAHTLGAVARSPCWRDPCHAPRHRIALRVVRQREQHIDIIAQLVVPLGGDKNAPFGKKGNVGRVQGPIFLDGQLHDAGAGGGGWTAHGWMGAAQCLECRVFRAWATSASSMRPALKGWSAVRAALASARDQRVRAPNGGTALGRSAGAK